MSLRPRYSLLTLLILTAFVAGGVKLWYGPHHVVEEREPGMTLEYTYTRDWRGEKIVEGPSMIRIREPNDPKFYVAATYFRQNKQLPFYYVLYPERVDPPDEFGSFPVPSIADLECLQELPMSASEREKFRQVVERARLAKDHRPGSDMLWCEFLDESPELGKNEFRVWEAVYQYYLTK